LYKKAQVLLDFSAAWNSLTALSSTLGTFSGGQDRLIGFVVRRRRSGQAQD